MLATVRKRLMAWWPAFEVYAGGASFDWRGNTDATKIYEVRTRARALGKNDTTQRKRK